MTHEELCEKAVRVVNSCKTHDQVESARKYVELFFKHRRDFNHFTYLIELLNTKIDSINSNQ